MKTNTTTANYRSNKLILTTKHVRAKASRALLNSTPRTFRIIITTGTTENKYDYGQLPSKQIDTNNKREEAWPGESLRSQHFWLDETPQVTWVISTCPIATAQRGTTSQKGRSMTRWSTWVFAFLIGRNASSHMNYINMSNSICAAQHYFTKGKKHDQVKHLGLRISDWTKRLKSE